MARRKRGPEEPFVVLEARITATVELPDKNKYNGQACQDPAVEAVIESLPQMIDVYVWGEQEKPARVYLEIMEEDVEIEEDHR